MMRKTRPNPDRRGERPGQLHREVMPWLALAASILAAAGACGPGLPSLEPLGRGPMAEEEPIRRGARSAQRGHRTSRDAGVEASPDTGSTDAGVVSAASDAGCIDASDAGVAANDSGDASEPGPAILAGEYLGPDYTIFRIDGHPEEREDDPHARTRVELERDATLSIVIVNSATGETICTLEAKAKGNEAVITPGQSCFAGGPITNASVRQGKAVFTGRRLVFDLMIDTEGEFEDGRREGEIEYHFDGVLP
ncbi:MAG: hypothetical protein JW751_24435 [Polyangiaceae bacterium]|nr:hypothetical protein [Polyangiaceae bacterium]